MKKIITILLFIIIIIITCSFIRLNKIYYREYIPVKLSNNYKNKIYKETINLTEYDIIIYSKEETRKLLKFSTKCESFNNERITKMHCVGYSRVYCTICNYLFQKHNIKGKAIQTVGYVSWNGINLNSFSTLLPKKWKNFTKDHDFVEVTCNNNKYYIDPTLNIIQKIN